MGNLFAELKRRHIYRVAAAYAVVAWVLLQLVNNVAPILELPPWIGRAVLLLLGPGDSGPNPTAAPREESESASAGARASESLQPVALGVYHRSVSFTRTWSQATLVTGAQA